MSVAHQPLPNFQTRQPALTSPATCKPISMNIRFLLPLLAIIGLYACEKSLPPAQDPLFTITVNNEFNELNGRFALFFSHPDNGETASFSWLPGETVTTVEVPDSKTTDRFDCTVVKITTLIAPGTGVRDTFIYLTTYTGLQTGSTINLRDQVYQQATDLKFQLVGMNTLDSIVVPDAYAIQRPMASNNYTGEYRCFHTGSIWLRVLVNDEKFWRFVRFDQVNSPIINANTLDINLLTLIFAPPIQVNFPFVAEWQYQVDGLIDTSKRTFFPLSRQFLPPGSFIPDIALAEIIEPVNNEQFEPNRPYEGFRMQVRGTEETLGGYTYLSDGLYTTLPADLPVPDFDLAPTILSDNRLIAVECSGNFDLLAFSRSRTGSLNLNWEVLVKPQTGIVDYRLPDVPAPLGDLYKPLKNYDLGGVVRARAEAYNRQLSFEQIVQNHLSASDVLWQAKAGYLGREEAY